MFYHTYQNISSTSKTSQSGAKSSPHVVKRRYFNYESRHQQTQQAQHQTFLNSPSCFPLIFFRNGGDGSFGSGGGGSDGSGGSAGFGGGGGGGSSGNGQSTSFTTNHAQHETYSSLYHSPRTNALPEPPPFTPRPGYVHYSRLTRDHQHFVPFYFYTTATFLTSLCLPITRTVEHEALYAASILPPNVIEYIKQQQQNTRQNLKFVKNHGVLNDDVRTTTQNTQRQQQVDTKTIGSSWGRWLKEFNKKSIIPLFMYKNCIAFTLYYHLLPGPAPSQPIYSHTSANNNIPIIRPSNHYTTNADSNFMMNFTTGAIAGVCAEALLFPYDTYTARRVYNDRPLKPNEIPHKTTLDLQNPSFFQHLNKTNNNNANSNLESKLESYYIKHYKGHHMGYNNIWAAMYYGSLFSLHDIILNFIITQGPHYNPESDIIFAGLSAGIVAGGISGVITHPLESAKRKMQIHGLSVEQVLKHCKYFNGFCNGIINGGIAGGLRGGVLFGGYEVINTICKNKQNFNGIIEQKQHQQQHQQRQQEQILELPSPSHQDKYTLRF